MSGDPRPGDDIDHLGHDELTARIDYLNEQLGYSPAPGESPPMSWDGRSREDLEAEIARARDRLAREFDPAPPSLAATNDDHPEERPPIDDVDHTPTGSGFDLAPEEIGSSGALPPIETRADGDTSWDKANWGGGWAFAPDYLPTGEEIFGERDPQPAIPQSPFAPANELSNPYPDKSSTAPKLLARHGWKLIPAAIVGVATAIAVPLVLLNPSPAKRGPGTSNSVASTGTSAGTATATVTSPYLDPALYTGTLRPAASCIDPKSCKSFVVSFTNTYKVTMNSFMIGIDNDPFTSFRLTGKPACKATGGEFGPDFKNAWLCLGLTILPNKTVTGLGIASDPLSPTTVARFDSSPAGNAKGLLPDYSQNIHDFPVPIAKAR